MVTEAVVNDPRYAAFPREEVVKQVEPFINVMHRVLLPHAEEKVTIAKLFNYTADIIEEVVKLGINPMGLFPMLIEQLRNFADQLPEQLMLDPGMELNETVLTLYMEDKLTFADLLREQPVLFIPKTS